MRSTVPPAATPGKTCHPANQKHSGRGFYVTLPRPASLRNYQPQ